MSENASTYLGNALSLDILIKSLTSVFCEKKIRDEDSF